MMNKLQLTRGIHHVIYDVDCRLRPVDVLTCFSWLLTMLACGWLGESAAIIRLILTSLTVVVSSCSLVSRSCSGLEPEPRLSRCVQFCFIFTGCLIKAVS